MREDVDLGALSRQLQEAADARAADAVAQDMNQNLAYAKLL